MSEKISLDSSDIIKIGFLWEELRYLIVFH